MRCGADNAGDSRFCGECGERLGTVPPVAESRSIAPGDGARPSGRTAALAAPVAPPGSTGETRSLPAPRAAARPTQSPSVFMSSASLGGAPARRTSTAAVVALVVVDLGLAVAGALFLRAGLAAAPVVAGTPAVIDAGIGDDAAIAVITPSSIDGGVTIIGRTVDAHPSGPQPDGGPAGIADAGGAMSVDGRGPALFPDSTIPIDPYGFIDAAVVIAPPDAAAPPPPDAAPDLPPGPADAAPPPPADAPEDDPRTEDLANSVEKKSAASQGRFERCYSEAAKAYTPEQPLAGEVDIAFRVMPTGEVQNAAAVRNTTGSATLGECLAGVLSAWTFPDNGLSEPTVVVRPFRFTGQ
ncbi:MAG: AgmX/PglI C-terminal domain-containing protein [Deltaproteobacteria bacterium]|nr:AgmX/PglI C-terminal domain-containing protein [Deltaproteobacteria bacterium]